MLHPRDVAHSGRLATLDLAMLNDLINRLPVTLRVAFVLHDIEGLDNRAVATHLRVDQTEVRRLVHNARLELLQLWRNNHPA